MLFLPNGNDTWTQIGHQTSKRLGGFGFSKQLRQGFTWDFMAYLYFHFCPSTQFEIYNLDFDEMIVVVSISRP
jgi:hypothetical protein